jgi:hypothetical protein
MGADGSRWDQLLRTWSSLHQARYAQETSSGIRTYSVYVLSNAGLSRSPRRAREARKAGVLENPSFRSLSSFSRVGLASSTARSGWLRQPRRLFSCELPPQCPPVASPSVASAPSAPSVPFCAIGPGSHPPSPSRRRAQKTAPFSLHRRPHPAPYPSCPPVFCQQQATHPTPALRPDNHHRARSSAASPAYELVLPPLTITAPDHYYLPA